MQQGRVVQSWVDWVGWLTSEMEAEKTKSSLILFVYNVTIGCSKKDRENHSRKFFRTLKEKKPGLKFKRNVSLNKKEWKLKINNDSKWSQVQGIRNVME